MQAPHALAALTLCPAARIAGAAVTSTLTTDANIASSPGQLRVTRPKRLTGIVALTAAALIARPFAASAQVVVVPNSLAAAEGNENVSIGGNLRVQQVHAASQFSGLGPIEITAAAFRLDANFGPFGPDTLPGLQVRLSTTSGAPDALSTTFAANVGPDVTTVFNGDWTRASTSAPGPGGTNVFDILLPFTTPFTYDPSDGNLLVDYIGNPAGNLLLLFPSQTDTHNVAGDSISTIIQEPASAPTGIAIGSFGVVTQFTFLPVPEPATVSLLALAAAGGMLRRRPRA